MLSKVAIHEVGHGPGLPHCKSGNPCLMKNVGVILLTSNNNHEILKRLLAIAKRPTWFAVAMKNSIVSLNSK
jgi:hypothetical protein